MELPKTLPTRVDGEEEEVTFEIPKTVPQAFPDRLPDVVMEPDRETLFEQASRAAEYAEDPEQERAKIENALNLAEFLDINERAAYTYQQQLIDEWNKGQVPPGEQPKNFLQYWKSNWMAGQLQNQMGEIGFRMIGLKPDSDEWKALYQRTQELRSQIPQADRKRFPIPVRWVGDMVKLIEQRRGGMKRGIALGVTMGAGGAMFAAAGGQLGPQIAIPEEVITVPVAFATFFGYGVTAGVASYIGEIEAGSHYLELIEHGIDPVHAKWAGAGVGIANMMLEMVQFQKLMQTIPGVKKVLKEGIEEASKRTLLRMWGAANRWAFKKYGRKLSQLPMKVVMPIVMQGIFAGKETLQEVSQEMTQIFSLELMDYLHNVEGREERKLAQRVLDAFPRMWETAKHSFGGFFLMGAPGNVMQTSMEDYSVLLKEKEVKNPVDLAGSQEEKAEELHVLSEQNKKVIDPILKKIDKDLGTKSTSTVKEKERILWKANDPDTRKDRPWYNVEHIRDSFRFKTVVEDFEQAQKAVETVALDPHVVEVHKVDTSRMKEPSEFGWRGMNLDIRLDNGQLVEYQLVLKDIDKADREGGRKIYERWRDVRLLERSKNWDAYQKDLLRSKEAYSKAFQGALTMLGYDETTFRASLRSLSRRLREVTSEKFSFKSTAPRTALYQTPAMRTIGIGMTGEAIRQMRPDLVSEEIIKEEVSKEKPPTPTVPAEGEKVKPEETWITRYRAARRKEMEDAGFTQEADYERYLRGEIEPPAPKVELTVEDIQDNAKKYYGTTANPLECGYIMNDGTMLDFSGRHYHKGYKPIPGIDLDKGYANARIVDHREVDIKAIFEEEDEGLYEANEKMFRFKIEGNALQVHFDGHSVSVMLQDGQNITEEQWNRIEWMRTRSTDRSIYYDIAGEDFYFRANGRVSSLNELKDEFYNGRPFEEFKEEEIREEAGRIQSQRMREWREMDKIDLVARIKDVGTINVKYFKGAEGLKDIDPWVKMQVFSTSEFAMDLDEAAAMMGMSDDQLIQEIKGYKRVTKPSQKIEDYFEEAKRSLRELAVREEEEAVREMETIITEEGVSGLFDPYNPPYEGGGYIMAMKLDNGDIYYDTRPGIHAEMIERMNIPAHRVESGGFIVEGDYRPSGGDTARIATQAQAKKRVEEKHRAMRMGPVIEKQTVNEMEFEEGMVFTIDGEQYRVVAKTTGGVIVQDSRKIILSDFENIEIDEGSLREAVVEEIEKAAPEEKQPWEMTKPEYIAQGIEANAQEAMVAHREHIQNAIDRGETVPAEVLAQYPGLEAEVKAKAAEIPAGKPAEVHALVKAFPESPYQKIVIQDLTMRTGKFHWTLFEKDKPKGYYEASREYDYDTYEEAQENLGSVMQHRKERGPEGALPPPAGKGPPPGGRRRMHKYFDDSDKELTDELWNAYQAYSNQRFADRDEEISVHIWNERTRFQRAIKSYLGHNRYTKEVQDHDIAMHIYLDLKRNPQHLEEYYEELTDQQKKWVDLSQKLPDELVAICDQILESYEEYGKMAKGNEVIRNIIDNYVSRTWDFKGEEIPTQLRKFGVKTRHALPRSFETIVEGWAYGYNLKIKGATNNLAAYKEEIWKTIVDKRFISALRKVKDAEGNPLVTTSSKYRGYKQIKNPNFKVWEYSATSDVEIITELMRDIYEHVEEVREGKDETGKAVGTIKKLRMIVQGALEARGMTEGEAGNAIDRLIASKNFEQASSMTKIIERQVIEAEMPVDVKYKPVGGKNFFQTDTGVILERKELFAHPLIANDLNNILGTSGLRGIAPIDELTRWNSLIKQIILLPSLFHHQAFIRSYYLPGLSPKRWNEMNFVQAYKAGVKMIENAEEEIILGIRNGLTINLRQDWDEELVNSETVVGKILDKCKATKAIKDTILDLRRRQVDFLFGEFGAGLKAKAFQIEFRQQLKKNPTEDPNRIAARVASMVNDDFGGLHLERMGRNPTLQHIFRLFLLAPDWTESNVRTMLKAFHVASQDGKELAMYQRFWAGVIIKGMGATVLANFALSGGDIDEFIKRYRIAWGENWRDVLQMHWMSIDITPIYRAFGGDRNKRKYFSLIGHFRDPFKFVLRPITSLKHKGSVISSIALEALSGTDWKGDKFTTLGELLETGQTVTYGKGRAIQWDQFPSYLISQLIGAMPTQIQNLIAWASGEMEAFDALWRSLGLHLGTKYLEKKGA